MEKNNEMNLPSIKTIYKSQKASAIKHFLATLPNDVIFSIAQTACNRKIIPENKEEAIDTILIYTIDLQRFFSYRRITSLFLSRYLYSHDVDAQESRFTRCQLVSKVEDLWDRLFPVGANEKKQEVPQSRVPALHSNDNDPKEVANHTEGNIATEIVPRHSPSTDNFSSEVSSLKFIKSDRFAFCFAEWFYSCLNNVHCESPQENVLDISMFCSNASVNLFIMNPSHTHDMHGEGAQECFRVLRDATKDHSLTFNPNLDSGTQAIKSSHGLVSILSCGTLHRNDDFLGVFEQEFGVVQSPNDKNWKIFFTKANFKYAIKELPTLPNSAVFEIECG